ncbi:MAG: TraB/GumN family protein [Alcanivoracaceae bacterium]|nr:TraB/GumN family protein [Alcanivoracaceae bacterium]
MRFLFIVLLSFSFLAVSTENQGNFPIEEVIAYGVRPGPELWKVSNGENVLWVLGTLSPLPKRMTWHSELVRAVIEDSQALIFPPSLSISADIGFFKRLSLITSVIGIKKNPGKKKLKDVIPADIYARWLVLKKKYMGNDRGVEKVRPLFAANKLFEKAITKIGLTNNTKVEKKVRKIAKKNKLEFITPSIKIDLKKPKSAIKKFKKSQISDLECFTKTLDRLETDLKTMRLRAFAWAAGDVSEMRGLQSPNQNKACNSAILNNEIAEDMGMTDVRPRLRQIWLEEATKALTNNISTFAILPISNLLGNESYLDYLVAQGYTVDVPK